MRFGRLGNLVGWDRNLERWNPREIQVEESDDAEPVVSTAYGLGVPKCGGARTVRQRQPGGSDGGSSGDGRDDHRNADDKRN